MAKKMLSYDTLVHALAGVGVIESFYFRMHLINVDGMLHDVSLNFRGIASQ